MLPNCVIFECTLPWACAWWHWNCHAQALHMVATPLPQHPQLYRLVAAKLLCNMYVHHGVICLVPGPAGPGSIPCAHGYIAVELLHNTHAHKTCILRGRSVSWLASILLGTCIHAHELCTQVHQLWWHIECLGVFWKVPISQHHHKDRTPNFRCVASNWVVFNIINRFFVLILSYVICTKNLTTLS